MGKSRINYNINLTLTYGDNIMKVEKKKLFYICDDNHENLFVGKLIRTDDELIDEVKKLEIGDIYPLSKTRYLMRES